MRGCYANDPQMTFMDDLDRHYVLSFVDHPFVVYEPRPLLPSARADDTVVRPLFPGAP